MMTIKKSIKGILTYCLCWRGLLLGATLALLLTAATMAIRPRTAKAHPCADASDCLFTAVKFIDVEEGFYSQPAISGDGTRIAFWSTGNLDSTKNANNSDGSIEIFVHYANSIMQVTESTGSILSDFNLEPSINYTGTHIAFFSDRDLHNVDSNKDNTDGNFEIFVADISKAPNDIKIIQVTDTTRGANISPSISGNGRYVVFASDAPEQDSGPVGNMEIFIAEISGTLSLTPTQITDTEDNINEHPVINRYGSRIAFISNADLDKNVDNSSHSLQVFVYDVDEVDKKKFIQVTRTSSLDIINDQPSINDDGKYIAYVSNANIDDSTNDNSNADGNQEIFRAGVGAAGRITYTQVTSTALTARELIVTNSHPDISGDGWLIIFTSNGNLTPDTSPNNADGNYENFVGDIGADLSADIKFVQLGDTTEVNSAYPSISTDGDIMAFSADWNIKKSTCILVDLSIGKAVSSAEFPPDNRAEVDVSAGDFLTYTIPITNAGPSTAIGVQLVDVLPMAVMTPTLTFTSNQTDTVDCATSPITIPHKAHRVTCNLDDMVNDTSAVIMISFQISPTYRGTITNTASVSSDVDEIELKDNTSRPVTATLFERSDLQIHTTADPKVMVEGTGVSFTYTLTITNNGPSDILSNTIFVTDTLPRELELYLDIDQVTVTTTRPQDSCGPELVNGDASVICAFDYPLNAGDTRTAFITIDTDSSLHEIIRTMMITNTAVVTSATFDPNLNPGSNVYTETTMLNVEADLEIDKSSSPMIPGSLITYTIIVSNSGPSTVVDATVSDTIPTVILTPTWTCTPSPNSSCTSGGFGDISDTVTITPGDTLTYIVTGTLPSSTTVTVVNTATVTVPTRVTETAPINNTDDDVGELESEADLQITKSAYPGTLIAGNTVTYTFTITNAGPSDAYNVNVTDTLPSGVAFGGEGKFPQKVVPLEAVGIVVWRCVQRANIGTSATASVSRIALNNISINAPNPVFTQVNIIPNHTIEMEED